MRLIDAAHLQQAHDDDAALGFEHDGELKTWLPAAGISPTAMAVAGGFVIRNAAKVVAASRRAQRDVARVVLVGVRVGLRLAADGRGWRLVSDDELEAALAAARAPLDQVDGDVYAWLEAAGVERDAVVVALSYVLRMTFEDGLAGQSHLPGWWVRLEGSLMLTAGLIAGLRLGRQGAEP